jgi:prepilin-type N-terminal cleavage/methylation domain-containing protein
MNNEKNKLICTRKKAFTIIEIMLAMLIISSILLIWFQSYFRVWFGKMNLVEQTNIEKNIFFFSEKLFELIKSWWSIDYEEYFNRKVVWTWAENWHYTMPTGFWNYWYWYLTLGGYWEWFYYCRSNWNEGEVMLIKSEDGLYINNWCYEIGNLNNSGNSQKNSPQRYWEYSFQFIDYNWDNSSDNLVPWDSNWDWNIIWDDDDEFLWIWPKVFEAGTDVKELYLLSWDKKHRTYIRWNVEQDPEAPIPPNLDYCDFDAWDTEWCIWTIEFLKLDWVDWWMDHINWDIFDEDWTQYDWVVDTWIINSQFVSAVKNSIDDVVASIDDTESYRQPLFPTSINVTDFKVFAYPNVDYKNAWKESDVNTNLSPYIILNYKVKPSWETRKKTKTEWKEISINTTINLTEIFSK